MAVKNAVDEFFSYVLEVSGVDVQGAVDAFIAEKRLDQRAAESLVSLLLEKGIEAQAPTRANRVEEEEKAEEGEAGIEPAGEEK